MKTIYYSKEHQFELSDEEFQHFIKEIQTKKAVYIERIGTFITGSFIWAGNKPKDLTTGRLHDGVRVKKVYGQWVDFFNETVRIDPAYYPEIIKDEIISEDEWQNRNQKQITAKTHGTNLKTY